MLQTPINFDSSRLNCKWSQYISASITGPNKYCSLHCLNKLFFIFISNCDHFCFDMFSLLAPPALGM